MEETGECVPDCGFGWYADSNGWVCRPCHDSCRTCDGGLESNCTSCRPDRFYRDNYCVYDCGVYGSWKNYNAPCYPYDDCGTCEWCHSWCSMCNGWTSEDCITCNAGFYLQPSQGDRTVCKGECPMTYFANWNTNECESCLAPCLWCTSSEYGHCGGCPVPYSLYLGNCEMECPSGWYSY